MANVNVVAYDPSQLASLTQLVNAHTAFVPPHHHFSESAVDLVAVSAHSLWEPHYEDEPDDPAETRTFCFAFNGGILAAGGLVMPEERQQPSVITWLVADPDHAEDTLPPLLDAMIGEARAAGFASIQDGRCAFGAGWFGIWEGWSHIISGIQAAGFTLNQRHHVLVSPQNVNLLIRRPSLPKYATGWHMNKLAGEWSLRAFSGETQIAEALVWALNPAFEMADVQPTWATLEWVEVVQDFRRSGIARFLVSEQMLFQARRGITRLVTVVEAGNHSALRLAESLSFESTGTCVTFSHRLV